QSLIARAKAKRLAQKPSWLRLGHWRGTLTGGWKSEADGKGFFVSPHGAEDPEAELDPTLMAFAAKPPGAKVLLPVFRRFPARLAWMSEHLGLDPGRIRVIPCPTFEEYWQRLRPQSATLVFSAYYLNNPASAFGHTFLRINRSEEAGTTKHEELLDHGID